MEPVGRDDIGITDSMYVLVLDNVLFNKCIHVSDKTSVHHQEHVCSLYDRYSLFIMSLWRYCMNMYCSVSETNVCLLPNFLHMFLKMYLTIYMSKSLSFVISNWKLSAKGQIISGQNCGILNFLKLVPGGFSDLID